MATGSKTPGRFVIVWALAWALVFIASAILFKGNPIKEWVQSALYIGAITFWFWKYQRLARSKG